MTATHLPPTTAVVRVEESALGLGPGANVRVRLLDNRGLNVRVRVEEPGVVARTGQEFMVPKSALNGGRR